MPLNPGQVLNKRYRIVKILGQGGFGAVYRAWDLNLNGPCAVKENFETSPQAQSQFAREASILYNLRHPNLPKVIDHFSLPEQGQYLVMEFIEGQDLQERIDQAGGPLPEAQVLSWMQQVCDALIYLHARTPPIIHRDLKPANVRITPEGTAFLVDFGIAKLYDPQRRTTLGARAATPGYAPFEQYGQKPTDARTDVYALGATIYAALTCKAPPESIERVGGALLQLPRELSPGISPQVESAVLRAMELMPDQRYQSVLEFKNALLTEVVIPAPVSIAPTVAAPEVIPPAKVQQTDRRSWRLWLGIFAALVLIGSALVVVSLAFRGDESGVLGFFVSTDTPRPVATATQAPLRPTDTKAPPPPAVEPFECADPLGCVTYPPGDPVRIASALVISGSNADLGLDSQHGVEIAMDFKGELLGHPIELRAEDEGCSPEGGQAAGQKIISDPSIVAVVGTSCSLAGISMSELISQAGYVMVSPSNTVPELTDPQTHQAGYLRVSHNDEVQGQVMAEFAYIELGLRKAAAIHDNHPYTEGLARAFADAFEGLGGEILAFVAINRGDTDMRPALTEVVAASPPEFLFYPLFTDEGVYMTRQAREVAGLEETILAAADGMISQSAIEAVGEAGEGMFFSGPDLSYEGGEYDRFLATYESKYGSGPLSVFHAHAFDAANMIFSCLEGVAVVEGDGRLHVGRQAMRDCLYATRDFQGITGNLTCSAYGDCADPRISVSQIQNGEYVRIWP